MISHGLHVSLHEKALLGRKRQDVLWIDHARAHGLQTNGDVIVPSYDDFALTIQGNSAWPTGDFDSLTHSERRVTLYPDWHDQARCNGRQDSWCGGLRLDHQPTIGWHPVQGQIPRQRHKANLCRETLGHDDHTDPGDIPDRPRSHVLILTHHRVNQGQIDHGTIDLNIQTWSLHNSLR